MSNQEIETSARDTSPNQLPELEEPWLYAPAHNGSWLYLSIVLLVIVAFSALPFISVDISVRSIGILHPLIETTKLESLTTGVLQKVLIRENQSVHKGQLLFVISLPGLEEKMRYNQAKCRELRLLVDDVRQLVAREKTFSIDTLSWVPSSSFYRQSLTSFLQEKRSIGRRLEKAQRDFDRNQRLFTERVIAEAEFESCKLERDEKKSEMENLRQSQLGKWVNDLNVKERELNEIQSQLKQEKGELANLELRAPLNGTIQNIGAVYAGSSVFEGQSLAELSPDTTLIADLQISPSDIGLVRKDMNVRMQVDAFNYNQWGHVGGKVIDISNDVLMVNNRPVFEVKCSLDQLYLKLSSGTTGIFKKGMTVQARLILTRRTLWDLIYDKADDWLNPNIIDLSKSNNK